MVTDGKPDKRSEPHRLAVRIPYVTSTTAWRDRSEAILACFLEISVEQRIYHFRERCGGCESILSVAK